MSSSAPTRGQRAGSRPISVTSNYVRTAGYSTSPHGPYVFVSPVLVPYVESPIRYGKGKSKKGRRAAAAKVRYVPALMPQQPVLYNRPYTVNARTVAAPVPVENYVPSSYAMSINPEAYCFKNGYISALSAPSPTYYVSDHPPQAVQSDLNPLSRPYTPSNRSKVDLNAANPQDGNASDKFWNPNWNTSSERSSPELWGESVSAVTSRAPTPSNPVCPYCRGWRQSNYSDTDSGVGGESDDEGFICSCDLSSISSDSHPEEDPFNLRFNRTDVGSIPQSTLKVVEFLCSSLKSHEWKAVARELGVDDVIIQSTDYDEFESVKEQMKSVFCLWAKTSKLLPHRSKCVQIKNALMEIGRLDLIDQVTAFC